jgi:corrinoid protein of di/trimethylamine methyltransferase
MTDEDFISPARAAMLEGDKAKAVETANAALAAGMSPDQIMSEGFIAGIRELGERFDEGEVFLPELMLAAEAMEAAMAVCNADLPEGKSKSRGVIVIGTVEGDVHDIGKAIVASYMRAAGFEVHDLGRDCPTDNFIAKAKEIDADVVGASALLTATLRKQQEIAAALKEEGIRDRVKFVVGGAVCTQGWADEIGADAYAKDAGDGIRKIEILLDLVTA